MGKKLLLAAAILLVLYLLLRKPAVAATSSVIGKVYTASTGIPTDGSYEEGVRLGNVATAIGAAQGSGFYVADGKDVVSPFHGDLAGLSLIIDTNVPVIDPSSAQYAYDAKYNQVVY